MITIPPSHGGPLAIFVSDGSAVSAESFGEAILSQIGPELFQRERAVFCSTPAAAARVGALAMEQRLRGRKVCVFSTLAMPECRQALKAEFPDALDLFDEILPKASSSLGISAMPRVGAGHGAFDSAARAARADAIDFALACDDGARGDYGSAEIILLGVSRSGKTPCAMWLAMHYGLRAANYPLTEEDLSIPRWPAALAGLERACAGLTLTAERLSEIRQARLPGSEYAKQATCRREIMRANELMQNRGLPIIDTTGRGVEEICAKVIEAKQLRPRLSF